VHLCLWKLMKLNYIKGFKSQNCIRHKSQPDDVKESKWDSYVRNKCTQYALNVKYSVFGVKAGGMYCNRCN